MDFWDNPTPYTVLIGGNKTLILRRKTSLDEISAAVEAITTATATVTTAATAATVAIQSIPPMKVNVQ